MSRWVFRKSHVSLHPLRCSRLRLACVISSLNAWRITTKTCLCRDDPQLTAFSIYRIFREPDGDAETKATVKVDPTAPSRSAIRRQRTIRHPPVRDGSLVTYSTRSSRRPPTYRSLFDHADGSRPSTEHAEFVGHSRGPTHLDDAGNVLHHGQPPYRRQAGIVDGLLDSEMVEVALGDSRSPSEELRRREDGERLLRDALHSEHPGRRMRAPRDSALRYALPSPPPMIAQSFSEARAGTPGEVYFMPSPPYSGGDRTIRASPTNNTQVTAARPPQSFSSRFAPAYPHNDHQSADVNDDLPNLVESSLHPQDSSDPRQPGLRRVGHLQPAPVDGLGDRRRSISSNSSGGEDTWQTLLTTIAPDEHLPSTDSSFTSATASASTSRSDVNSSRSSETWLTAASSTVPSALGSGYRDLFHACDLSDSDESGTESDLVYLRANGHNGGENANSAPPRTVQRRARWVPGRHGRPGRWILPDSEAASRLTQLEEVERNRVNRPPARMSQTALRTVGRRMARRIAPSRTDEQPLRHLPQGPSAPASEMNSISPESETELEHMHSILERLARREDIPDEWWAAVGLSRTLVGRQDSLGPLDGAGIELE